MSQGELQSAGKEPHPLKTATRTGSLQTSRERCGPSPSSSWPRSHRADLHRGPHREARLIAGGQGGSQRFLLGDGRPVIPGGVASIDVSPFIVSASWGLQLKMLVCELYLWRKRVGLGMGRKVTQEPRRSPACTTRSSFPRALIFRIRILATSTACTTCSLL